MMILVVCDDKQKYDLRVKVVNYGESLLGIKPDHIIVLKPTEPNERIREYIRSQVKIKLQKGENIIYL